jgi:regulator of replication initiation timing
MNSKKFIIALAVTLFIVSLQANITTLKTDIRLLQDENNVLEIKVKALQEQQAELDSRVTYTVTVEQIEPIIAEINDCKARLDKEVTANKSLNEILSQMFGSEVWGK